MLVPLVLLVFRLLVLLVLLLNQPTGHHCKVPRVAQRSSAEIGKTICKK